MIHFTSDTHFGHANVIKYSNRPFSDAASMDEALILNWNAVVAPTDTVWHLGDFGFTKHQELETILRRLNGTKHLVFGNHDKTIRKQRNSFLGPGLFASIQDYAEIKAEGLHLVLFHYGGRVWNKSHHGSIMLYGHSHGSLPPHGKSVDVGVDCSEISEEYRPYSEGSCRLHGRSRNRESRSSRRVARLVPNRTPGLSPSDAKSDSQRR